MSVGVYEGHDKWLFLTGGSNEIGSLYDRNAALLPDAKLQQWARLIEERARRCEYLGIQYVHLSIPEKLTIYDHKLHDPPIVDWTLSPAMRLSEMLQKSRYRDVWLDLIGPFRAARDRQQLYFKTDTHLTAHGSFLAYSLLCGKAGLGADATLLERPYHEADAMLDLGSRMDPVALERVKLYNYTKQAVRLYRNSIAKYLEQAGSAALMHVGSHVAYRNDSPSASKKKVLIFGDSYSSIRPDGLTAMVAETAREVEFVWSSNLDWAYIKRSRPDVLIYELVERFMTIVPNDELSLRALAVRQGLKAEWIMFKARRRAATA